MENLPICSPPHNTEYNNENENETDQVFFPSYFYVINTRHNVFALWNLHNPQVNKSHSQIPSMEINFSIDFLTKRSNKISSTHFFGCTVRTKNKSQRLPLFVLCVSLEEGRKELWVIFSRTWTEMMMMMKKNLNSTYIQGEWVTREYFPLKFRNPFYSKDSWHIKYPSIKPRDIVVDLQSLFIDSFLAILFPHLIIMKMMSFFPQIFHS